MKVEAEFEKAIKNIPQTMEKIENFDASLEHAS
jgi:hypothetical protein